ncbi:MAG: DUF2637 domain-containing protein [Streptosporangiales bacterium]|nr:DUF2637 domain-containing protein [Streptosporangiales bacterium]
MGTDLEHGGSRPPRRGALWIAGFGVTLITAAAFVLSYEGLYAAALAGGVRPTLAFLYPTIFDGFLLLAFAAAVVLRSNGLRATWYPWLLIVVLLAAAGGANVLHAVGRESLLPPESMRVAVAAVPPIALGLAFPLWLLLFAHLRGGRRAQRSGRAGEVANDIVPGLQDRDTGAREPDVREAEEPADSAKTDGDESGGPASEPSDTDRSSLTGRPDAPPPITPPSSKVRSSPIPPDA